MNTQADSDATNRTISFYDREAQRYAASTVKLDLSDLRQRFTEQLPLGGRILDVGCGSGRDLQAFRLLGFDAMGIEPSVSLAKLAEDLSDAVVSVTQVQDCL